MMTIIEIEAREDGGHGIQSQSHRTECWLDGWIAVPQELEEAARACQGYCTLDIQEGVLVGLTPGEIPTPPEPEPTPTVEELQAKIAALTTSNQMLEDCLVEMAAVVYA